MGAKKYVTGCKAFLVGIEIGQEIVLPNIMNYDSIRNIVCRLKKDFGCVFKCRASGEKKYVRRIS